jgi:hypothetical protein
VTAISRRRDPDAEVVVHRSGSSATVLRAGSGEIARRCLSMRNPAISTGPRGRVGTPRVVSGGELLALRMSLRARGLRGLDVLRRSQDRAPPATA